MKLDDRVHVHTSQGAVYSAEVWAVIDECREHCGELTHLSLGRYGLSGADARSVYELALEVRQNPLQRGERAFWSKGFPWNRKAESYAVQTVRPMDVGGHR